VLKYSTCIFNVDGYNGTLYAAEVTLLPCPAYVLYLPSLLSRFNMNIRLLGPSCFAQRRFALFCHWYRMSITLPTMFTHSIYARGGNFDSISIITRVTRARPHSAAHFTQSRPFLRSQGLLRDIEGVDFGASMIESLQIHDHVRAHCYKSKAIRPPPSQPVPRQPCQDRSVTWLLAEAEWPSSPITPSGKSPCPPHLND